MSYMAGKKYFAVVTAVVLISSAVYLCAEKKDASAEIESLRKDGIVTMLSSEKPDKPRYEIRKDNVSVGSFLVLQIIPVKDKGILQYRTIARFENISASGFELKTGQTVLLKEYRDVKPLSYITDKKSEIISEFKAESSIGPDNRIMVLIPEGTYYFGADNGDPDEAPRSIEYLDAFYIDKNEVANKDFLVYVDAAHAAYPKSWGGVFPSDLKNMPVIVTFNEAKAYALWSGKRLPTENEWEKAAAGSLDSVVINTDDGYSVIRKKTAYPWGNDFIKNRCNCNETAVEPLTRPVDAGRIFSGLIPVDSGGKDFSSAWGLYHMAGNIQEWTDSWYDAYHGSTVKNQRYGKKFKVMRGGSWYNSIHAVRVTSREPGGMPSLDDDVIAGFRCVRDPAASDRIP